MAAHNELGQRGEVLALEFVKNAGFKVIATNWRYGRAEVDLIFLDKQTLVFGEVKTRSSVIFGQPEEFVDDKKKEMFAKAADGYIYENNWQGEIRFDIIAIVITKSSTGIRHFKDAFWLTK